MSITTFKLNKNEYYNNNDINNVSLLTNNYLVLVSNKYGEANFYFNIIIKYIGITIANYNLVPNQSGGRLTTDITNLIKNYLSDIALITNKDSVSVNLSSIAFEITVNEYYSGPLQSTSTKTFYFRKQKPRNLQDEQIYCYNYAIDNITHRLLTKVNNNYINLNKANFFGLIMQKTLNGGYPCSYTLAIELDNVNKLILDMYFPTNAVEISNYNLTKLIKNNFTAQQISTAKTLKIIAINDDMADVDTLVYNVINTNESFNIVFLNDFGIYESVTFFDSFKDLKNNTQTYEQKANGYLSTWIKGGQVNVNNVQITTLTAWTGWLDPISVEYIYKNIYASKKVFLQSEDEVGNWIFTPITPIAGNAHFTSNEFTDLQNCSITFELEIYDNI